MVTLVNSKSFCRKKINLYAVRIVKKPEVYFEPKARAQKIMELLEKEHTDAEIALQYKNPLELLVATILSAQATDEQINAITPKLFQKYTTAKDYADAERTELEQDIKSSGFYHNKAKNIQNSAKMLVENYNGQVPNTMEELVKLPGVARKTANIVLFNAYDIIAGVAVDTHVRRLAQRLGLSENSDPNKIEKDLMNLVPKDKWMRITDLLIFHGRRVCTAKKPRCDACVLNKICPSAFTFN
jgi:endonuclease-3